MATTCALGKVYVSPMRRKHMDGSFGQRTTDSFQAHVIKTSGHKNGLSTRVHQVQCALIYDGVLS